MLVHRRVTPSSKSAGTHLYTWAERGTIRVKCLAQEHNVLPRSGLEPGPPGPDSSALTIRHPRIPPISLRAELITNCNVYSCWSWIFSTVKVRRAEARRPSWAPLRRFRSSRLMHTCTKWLSTQHAGWDWTLRWPNEKMLFTFLKLGEFLSRICIWTVFFFLQFCWY